MPSFTDQMGRTIVLERPPVRIVSLVPSQTELLYALGLDDFAPPGSPVNARVVGITKFCVHPPAWFRNKPRIGGTKDIDLEKIDALQPDLIIANKEENERAQIETLASRYPVWISDIKTLADALAMIRALGDLTGRPQQALTLATTIEKGFQALSPVFPPEPPNTSPFPPKSPGTGPTLPNSPRTAYLIWRKPWMAAGGGTFIHDMLQRCGFINIFGSQDRYPIIDPASPATSNCDLILLSSEPYPFREKHVLEIQTLLPDATIRLVDGEIFSWYGSRLLHAPAYFQQLLRELPPFR
jgi:ABC-type Fe3+-hydroxamate transport system substrate-binding protein